MSLSPMFADVTVASGTIISLVTALGLAIVVMFKLLISAKDRQIAYRDKQLEEMAGVKKSYEEIAAEAMRSLKETADFYRLKYEGKPPIVLAAPVISESHSPSTKAQREAADVATKRASLANIKLVLGQMPRVEPEHADEKAMVADLDKSVKPQ